MLVPHHIGVSDIHKYDAVVAMDVGFATDVFDLPYTAPPVRQGDLPLTLNLDILPRLKSWEYVNIFCNKLIYIA